jgi:2'-5' RNA ligase
MDPTGLTSVFSLCFTLDPTATQAVNAIRQTLPASPYRDDTPHITLLRTIKCPTQMSDVDLLGDMERLLGLSEHLPFTATVHKSVNSFSPLFRISSLVILRASPEMKAYRKHVMRVLKANNYSIGLFERLAFLPHISVRLGVPFSKKAKKMTEQSFVAESKLTFKNWMILRDIKRDGKYLVKEISQQT